MPSPVSISVSNEVLNEVLNEVPNSVPAKPMTYSRFSKLIEPLMSYVRDEDGYSRRRASRSSRREDITVKEVIAEEPFAELVTFVDDVLSKPFFSAYVTVELVDALKDLQCVYDEAFLVHGEHSSRPPSTEWVSQFLSSTETFRNIYTIMGLTPIESSGTALRHLCRELSYLLWANHSTVQDAYEKSRADVERPALLKAICKKLSSLYTDGLYREYREWYSSVKGVEEEHGNRYGDIADGFIKSGAVEVVMRRCTTLWPTVICSTS
jgi:hypothetical protein